MTALTALLDEIATHRQQDTAPRVTRLVSEHRPGQHIVYRLEPGEFGSENAITLDGADRYWALLDLGSVLFIQGHVELDPQAARAVASELIAWANWREGEGAIR